MWQTMRGMVNFQFVSFSINIHTDDDKWSGLLACARAHKVFQVKRKKKNGHNHRSLKCGENLTFTLCDMRWKLFISNGNYGAHQLNINLDGLKKKSRWMCTFLNYNQFHTIEMKVKYHLIGDGLLKPKISRCVKKKYRTGAHLTISLCKWMHKMRG